MADAGQISVRAKARQIVIEYVCVHGVAAENAVILYVQLFRRLVQDQDDRECGQRQAPAVDHLRGSFRHLGKGLDHAGIDLVGVSRGDHIVRVDLVPAGSANTVRLPFFDQDLVHLLAVLDLHAHLLSALRHFKAHLVAELLGDHGAVAHIVRHEHRVDREGQI